MEQVGAAAPPVLIGMILIFGFVRGVPVFDSFVSGAKDGLQSTLRVFPTLLGLILAVTMLRASGFLELMGKALAPALELIGISPELVPLALLRPVSGGGSTAYVVSLFQSLGPDSETGKIAAILSSSTETTFYAITVYFGACRYKRLYYTVPAALLGDMAAVIFSVLTVKLFS